MGPLGFIPHLLTFDSYGNTENTFKPNPFRGQVDMGKGKQLQV